MDFSDLIEQTIKVFDMYVKRHQIEVDIEYSLHKLYEEVGEYAQAILIKHNKCRIDKRLTEEAAQKLVSEELADILGLLIVNAKLLGVDLEKAFYDKWLYKLEIV